MVVVAFTSVGRGAENDGTVFFSKELTPIKSPDKVAFIQLNSTAINVTWVPLNLFEARGFPQYIIELTLVDNASRKKRQSLRIVTNNSFAIFTGLQKDAQYSTVVGVRTDRSNASAVILQANPIIGTYVSTHYYYQCCNLLI